MERTNPRVLIPFLGVLYGFMAAVGTGDFDFPFSLRHPHSFITGFTGGYGVVQEPLDFFNVQAQYNFIPDSKGRYPLKA